MIKGYHQIRVRPADVHKTAFVTMGQHYEYLRMPFGMVNSGMTRTRAVRKLLDGMDNVVDYIDDLLVHTRVWEEHVQTLKELFKRLKAANFVARPTKCVFGATQVDFLGHCLGQGMIGLQDVNVKKMRDALRPSTKIEIRSFLEPAGYYQDFILHFAAIAASLSDHHSPIAILVPSTELKEKIAFYSTCFLPPQKKHYLKQLPRKTFIREMVYISEDGVIKHTVISYTTLSFRFQT